MSLDDETLMVQAARGSREAFTELVNRYEARLIAYFLHHGGHQDSAEDCAQEVFARLYRNRERYGPEAKFSTFLFTIARNYWIDVVRSRRSRATETSLEASRGEGNPLDRIGSTQPGPEDAAVTAESTDQLRSALQGLPESQREVMMLGVIQELPYAEVSAILGIPIGTVKSRVHAAVQTLRQVLVTGSSSASSVHLPARAARARKADHP